MIQQKIILTKDECNQIIDLVNHNDFTQSSTTNSLGETSISDFRTSNDVVFNTTGFLENLLLPKLKPFGIKSLPKTAVLIRYDIGQEFKMHTDSGGIYGHRKKSISIQLSEEDDYTGGHMVVWGPEIEILFDKTIGNMILFNSEKHHQVFPIFSGTRYSLVMWFSIENLSTDNLI